MDHGRVLALDTPAALVRGLGAPVRVTVLASALPVAEAEAIAGADGVEVDRDSLTLTTTRPESVLAELARRGALEGLQVRGATLEDVFLDLTGREYRP
jgi:ABC-2 type transport system ATP-binding protein